MWRRRVVQHDSGWERVNRGLGFLWDDRAHLKCPIDCNTSSSNSIGPGISRAGCSACLDIFSSFAVGSDTDGDRFMGVYSRSSDSFESLSVEKGVLISSCGLCSRCLEMRESLARGGARAKGGRGLRQKGGASLAGNSQDDVCKALEQKVQLEEKM